MISRPPPQASSSSADRGVCPNSPRYGFDGFYLRFRTRPPSMSLSFWYCRPRPHRSEPEESYLHVVSSRGVSGPRAGDAHRWPIVHIPATIPLTYDTRGVALAGGVAVA
jgi:hypothetical protein